MVIKFGGTSVSSVNNWSHIAQIVRDHRAENRRVVIVCSAISKMTRALDQLIHEALVTQDITSFAKIEERYQQLAAELSVDFSLIASDLRHLRQLTDGVCLLQEASPRTRAQILAFGELMLTRLGHAYLFAHDINCQWLDMRTLLRSCNDTRQHPKKHYLAAYCDTAYDPDFEAQLTACGTDVVITQGFIASDSEGDTVLLGWGGSDISAAYAAAKLRASICEIWTDVPGIYTANPHQIPQARLLRQLDYEEAQEIAAMGAKVLHPSTIPPLQQANIPLKIKYTAYPQHHGSLITHESEQRSLRIKSILTKYHITLITIETLSMWHQSGFLAQVFNCFAQHDLSVDLVSTSESSVTVTLDNEGQVADAKRIQALLDDLNYFSQARVITPCAQVTLVGRHMRSILHCFGPVFEVFESQQIHLLSQSANDLNLSFIVDEDQAERIAKKLHVTLIQNNPESYYYSKSWQEEFTELAPLAMSWWRLRRDDLLQLATQHSPCYVYDNQQLINASQQLLACDALDCIFYAMKANANQKVLQTIYQQGLGFECVSVGELKLILSLFPDIDRKRILFTPNFAPKSEYQYAFEQRVYVTVDAIYPLEHWPEIFKGQQILLRIDPGIGLGHHRYVSTGGNASKFGIPQLELEQLAVLTQQQNITVIGLHAHYGSGILQADLWNQTATLLTELTCYFPSVKIINLGGGLGIVERPGQRPLDTVALNKSLQPMKQQFPQLQFWIEPGRFLVAAAGVILAKVTQLKQKGDTQFIGIEAGMNFLIRPSLYGSYHEIVNLTKLNEPRNMIAHIVGPICESGDTLGFSRYLPHTEEGDVMLIANTGAYGFAMSSNYNLRAPSVEEWLP